LGQAAGENQAADQVGHYFVTKALEEGADIKPLAEIVGRARKP
jgi:hypothetical protein